MEKIERVWTSIQLVLSAIGGWLGFFLGNLDGLLTALIVFIAIDYITGVMCAVLDKELNSSTGFRGIFKKFVIFTLVGIAHIMDVHVIGSGSGLRSAVIFFYLSNEGLSILENSGRLGLPIPERLKDILAQLHKRKDPDE